MHRKRSALERINARVGRDFQLEHHYMQGLETMQMRVALSLSVMLADGLYVDPRGSAAAHEIADSATGSLTAVKPSTRQCLAAGTCAA